MAVGFIIGVLVPHWYRLNKQIPPVQYLKLLMQDKRREIQDEWQQAGRHDDILDGFLFASAHVASSDGHVDNIERQQLQDFLEQLATVHEHTFDIDDAVATFNRFAGLIIDARRQGTKLEKELNQEFDGLEIFKGRPTLSKMLVYLCLSVGRSYSMFDVEEQNAVTAIINTLNLDLDRYDLRIGHWRMA